MRKEEIRLGMPCIATIGFLVGVDEHWVAIAQSVAEDQLGHVIRIPRGSIHVMTEIDTVVETPKAEKT